MATADWVRESCKMRDLRAQEHRFGEEERGKPGKRLNQNSEAAPTDNSSDINDIALEHMYIVR